ncbi:hypothetical protein DFH27DRAFT_653860 [Peziza echinospora]|nr:hypothetical protein DFH27DRAFT_653860 [Peziza echinospora]
MGALLFQPHRHARLEIGESHSTTQREHLTWPLDKNATERSSRLHIDYGPFLSTFSLPQIHFHLYIYTHHPSAMTGTQSEEQTFDVQQGHGTAATSAPQEEESEILKKSNQLPNSTEPASMKRRRRSSSESSDSRGTSLQGSPASTGGRGHEARLQGQKDMQEEFEAEDDAGFEAADMCAAATEGELVEITPCALDPPTTTLTERAKERAEHEYHLQGKLQKPKNNHHCWPDACMEAI